MDDEVLEELQDAIGKAHEALKRELAKLRTGRAHPSMLDSVRVDYYGQVTPIGQMATVSIPEPRMLTVKPWDKSQLKAIEKALRECNLGLNPQADGELLRIPVPPLSEERRKDLVKVAKRQGEDCKIAIRKARHDAIDMLNQMKSDGDLGEDAVDRAKKKVEETVGKGGDNVDQLVASKEKDILEV